MERYNQILKKDACLRRMVNLIRSVRFAKIPAAKVTDLYEPARIEFDIPPVKGSELESLDFDDLYLLGVCGVPSLILNLVVCAELSKAFDLSQFSEFAKLESGSFVLDVSPKYRNGFLLPRRNRDNKYYGLTVYRYPSDKSPFFLKTRREVEYV